MQKIFSFAKRLFIKQSDKGKSVFSKGGHKKGEKILEFTGKVLNCSEIEFDSYEDEHCLQIEQRTYLGHSNAIDDFVNHSCEPNSGVRKIGGQIFLIALKDIQDSEEVVWDYSTWSVVSRWKMKCHCGNRSCRGTIRSFQFLPETTKNKYIKLGIVPDYILFKK